MREIYWPIAFVISSASQQLRDVNLAHGCKMIVLETMYYHERCCSRKLVQAELLLWGLPTGSVCRRLQSIAISTPLLPGLIATFTSATNDMTRRDLGSYQRPQHAIAPPETLLIAGTMFLQLLIPELQDCRERRFNFLEAPLR